MKNGHVLVVDDSLTVRMDLVEALEAVGLRATPCATLSEARAALATAPIDVIVLDVRLPDGDGVELLREIRARAPDVVVLMLSSEAELKDRVRGLATGAHEYIGKPYDAAYVTGRAQEIVIAKRPPPSRARVLVIDDSASFRAHTTELLERVGYEVVSAASGEIGLRMVASARPNLVLVDGQMPGMDGASVIRRIRLDAALRTTPCILLTGSDGAGGELDALDAGADAYVRKSDDAEVLLVRLDAVLRGTATGTAPAAESLLSPKRILAVDDSPTYLEELAQVLGGEGYDVALTRSGEEALELLELQSVDCVLLDLRMPGIGGNETVRRIRSSPAYGDTPVIMLTALDDRDAMIGSLVAGADDYISKSSELDVLRARVRAQLRRRQSETETRRVREELLQREIEMLESRAARELAETKAALVDELERKNRELEAFSYSVSHDLRAPLRSILGFSEALLEEDQRALDENARDYLRRIGSAARRMNELIDDMLLLSRVTRAELVRTTFDMSAMASTIGADLARETPGREIELVVEPGITVHADPSLCRILLENLLGNAFKFTAHTARARIMVGVEARDGAATYFVRDNGAGFDPAYAEKLFRPFQRLHTEADFAGTGIGLATVYRIVDRHAGAVTAKGEIGRGATFSFTLEARNRGETEGET